MPQHLASCSFKVAGKVERSRENRTAKNQLPCYLESQSSPETEGLQILPETSVWYLQQIHSTLNSVKKAGRREKDLMTIINLSEIYNDYSKQSGGLLVRKEIEKSCQKA